VIQGDEVVMVGFLGSLDEEQRGDGGGVGGGERKPLTGGPWKISPLWPNWSW
jgi:hypothetical protein